MIRLLLAMIFLFPLFLTAETITVKTKAPQNRNAVFQYRVPRGYDNNRREMYRVLVIFGGKNTDGKSEAIGFYPKTSPGVGAIWGQSYPGELSNDANRPSGYVTMTFDLTKEQYDAAKNRIDTNWRAKEDQTTPNWQLSNNCMNFMLDVFDATGKSSEIDTSSWRTNGWLDPRKGYTWMLQNGGKIKE